MMKKYVSEGLGAFILTLVVALGLAGVFPVSVPILAALTLGLFVYTLGHVSGIHINPAVTAGLWSLKKISTDDAVKYIVAQFIGAGAALMLIPSLVAEPRVLSVTADFGTGLAELVGTALFTFGIAAVVYGKVPGSQNGMVIGGSLLLGIAVAALLGSNGVLNPAVALGVGSFNVMYVLGPILGSILGMQIYRRLAVMD